MSLQKKNKRKSQDESSMWNHVIQYNLRNKELINFQLLNRYCQYVWQKQKKQIKPEKNKNKTRKNINN